MTTAEAARLLELPPDATSDLLEQQYARLVFAVEQRLAGAPSVAARTEDELRLRELSAAREVLLAPADQHDPAGPAHARHGHGVAAGLVLGALLALALVVGLGSLARRDARRATGEVIPVAGPVAPAVRPSPVTVATPAPMPAESPADAGWPAAVPVAAVEAPPATRYHVIVDPNRGALVAVYRQPLMLLPADQVELARAIASRLEQLQRRAGRLSETQLDELLRVGLTAPAAEPVIFSINGAETVPLVVIDPTIAAAVGWRDPWAIAVWWQGLANDALRLLAGRPARDGLALAAGGSLAPSGVLAWRGFQELLRAQSEIARARLATVPWQAPPTAPAIPAPVRPELARAAEVEVQTNYGSRLAFRKRLDQPGNWRTIGCGERLQPRLLSGYWLQVHDPATRRTGYVVHRDQGGDLVHLPTQAPAAAAARGKRLLSRAGWRSFRRGSNLVVTQPGGVELRAEPCDCAPEIGRLSDEERVTVIRELGNWLEVQHDGKPAYFRWHQNSKRFVTAWLSPAEVLRGRWERIPLNAGRMSAEFPAGWRPRRVREGGWYRLAYRDDADGLELSIRARSRPRAATAADFWDRLEDELAAQHGGGYRPLEIRRGPELVLSRYDLRVADVYRRRTTALAVEGSYAYGWTFGARRDAVDSWQPVLERFQESVRWGE